MYKTVKSRGTKVEIISLSKISTGFAKACQSRKAMQADDVEESSFLFNSDFTVGLACHGSSSEHVGEIERSQSPPHRALDGETPPPDNSVIFLSSYSRTDSQGCS